MSTQGDSVADRARTAVLGLDHPSTPSQSLPGPSVPTITTTPLQQVNPKSVRGVGRRKQLRRDNARLASNPHVVRPTVRDFSLKHNERLPSFPLPPELKREFFRRTDSRNIDVPDRSSEFGAFTMGLSDANWFLQHRVGVQPLGPKPQDGQVKTVCTPAQAFARQVETHIESWLRQDVFVHATPSCKQSLPLIRPEADYGEDEQSRQSRTLWEIGRNDHNMIWSVTDPFLRLIIHCLARTHGCASFSKDTADGHRQTWILRARRQGSANANRGQSGMPTPPTTDVGTDVTGSDAASALDSHSEYYVSDIGEAEEGEGGGEDYDEGQSTTADTTARESITTAYRINERHESDDDDAALADVEE